LAYGLLHPVSDIDELLPGLGLHFEDAVLVDHLWLIRVAPTLLVNMILLLKHILKRLSVNFSQQSPEITTLAWQHASQADRNGFGLGNAAMSPQLIESVVG
jgi:hypothetical protein